MVACPLEGGLSEFATYDLHISFMLALIIQKAVTVNEHP
jgi:hypothetical protein